MWQGAGRYPWQIQCPSGREPGRYPSPRRRKGSRGQLRSHPQPHCRQGGGQGAHCRARLSYGAVPLQSRERGQQEQPRHGAGLAPNPPSPGARDGAWRGDGGFAIPLPPGFGPISNVSWHHMVLALFVLLRLGKEGRLSLSARGGGTQDGNVPVSRGMPRAGGSPGCGAPTPARCGPETRWGGGPGGGWLPAQHPGGCGAEHPGAGRGLGEERVAAPT